VSGSRVVPDAAGHATAAHNSSHTETAVGVRSGTEARLDVLCQRPVLEIGAAEELALIEGARSPAPVRGLTHGFYKYPARFSPLFARAAINAFTAERDWVLDNHMGGGTSLVEAISLGRNAVGVDISSLADFVSRVKTTILSDNELESLRIWTQWVGSEINVHRKSDAVRGYEDLRYYKHMRAPQRWRLRKAIEQGISAAESLQSNRLESFARCVILRAAQWALDGRATTTSVQDFREAIIAFGREMIDGSAEFRSTVSKFGKEPQAVILNRSSAGLESERGIPAPKLILTSPPYPGLHILYHRWQVDGRKEAPLPFMIANKLDGAGSSYYTMGDRRIPQLTTYFANIEAVMTSAALLSSPGTILVQMVAFAEASWQLQRYLDAMSKAGFSERFLPSLVEVGDGRLWRSVPSRRWYSEQRGRTGGSEEVVLMHVRQ
jgi:hypothetical protein